MHPGFLVGFEPDFLKLGHALAKSLGALAKVDVYSGFPLLKYLSKECSYTVGRDKPRGGDVMLRDLMRASSLCYEPDIYTALLPQDQGLVDLYCETEGDTELLRVVSPWVLRIELNACSMRDHGMKMEDVEDVVTPFLGADNIQLWRSDNNDYGHQILRIRVRDNDGNGGRPTLPQLQGVEHRLWSEALLGEIVWCKEEGFSSPTPKFVSARPRRNTMYGGTLSERTKMSGRSVFTDSGSDSGSDSATDLDAEDASTGNDATSTHLPPANSGATVPTTTGSLPKIGAPAPKYTKQEGPSSPTLADLMAVSRSDESDDDDFAGTDAGAGTGAGTGVGEALQQPKKSALPTVAGLTTLSPTTRHHTHTHHPCTPQHTCTPQSILLHGSGRQHAWVPSFYYQCAWVLVYHSAPATKQAVVLQLKQRDGSGQQRAGPSDPQGAGHDTTFHACGTPYSRSHGRTDVDIALCKDGRYVITAMSSNCLHLADVRFEACDSGVRLAAAVAEPLAGTGAFAPHLGSVNGRLSVMEGGHADGRGVEAKFDVPMSTTVQADGSLVVADCGNNMLRTVAVTDMGCADSGASVATLAGSGEQGHADGPALEAKFNHPSQVAAAQCGCVLVLDGDRRNCLRVVARDGAVVATIGSAAERGHVDGPSHKARFGCITGIAALPGGGWVVCEVSLDKNSQPFDKRETPHGGKSPNGCLRRIAAAAGCDHAHACKHNHAGDVVSTVASGMIGFCPVAVAADIAGHVVVFDKHTNAGATNRGMIYKSTLTAMTVRAHKVELATGSTATFLARGLRGTCSNHLENEEHYFSGAWGTVGDSLMLSSAMTIDLRGNIVALRPRVVCDTRMQHRGMEWHLMAMTNTGEATLHPAFDLTYPTVMVSRLSGFLALRKSHVCFVLHGLLCIDVCGQHTWVRSLTDCMHVECMTCIRVGPWLPPVGTRTQLDPESHMPPHVYRRSPAGGVDGVVYRGAHQDQRAFADATKNGPQQSPRTVPWIAHRAVVADSTLFGRVPTRRSGMKLSVCICLTKVPCSAFWKHLVF